MNTPHEQPDAPRNDRLAELMAECTDGRLDDAQSAELAALLKHDAAARQRYVRYMMTDALLETELHVEHAVLDPGALGTGAGSGTTGSADDTLPIARPIRLADVRAARRSWLSYAAVAAAAAITAAVTMTLLSAMFRDDHNAEPVAVQERAGASVAIVTDLSSAEWRGGEQSRPEIGTQMSRGAIHLGAGTAQLMFNGGAVVDVIGPADFELLSEGNARLTRGKILAWVPPRAHGFTVQGPGLKVVDLGTQFGMNVRDDGKVELHVVQGEIEARFDTPDATDDSALALRPIKEPVRLTERQALRFDPATGIYEMTAIERVRFNRRPVAEGQARAIDLLDIVAWGDGEGEANVRGVEPHNAEKTDKWYHNFGLVGTPGYKPVRWSPQIDGVFVPNGADGAVQLNSAGDTFDGFPTTDRKFVSPIWTHRPRLDVGSKPVDLKSLPEDKRNWIREAGPATRYNPEQRGLLALHANAGITFDLNALRAQHQGMRLVRFHATTGNIQGPGSGKNSPQAADVWVFVDGELRFSRARINSGNGTFEVDVELTDRNRFLTLAATDSSNGYYNDQIVFGDPVIELESR